MGWKIRFFLNLDRGGSLAESGQRHQVRACSAKSIISTDEFVAAMNTRDCCCAAYEVRCRREK
jgi:hypothetical protein